MRRGITRRLPLKLARARSDRPVASITFDDFPKSAWTGGGPILRRFGARATYYAAGRFCAVSEDGIEYYDEADLRAVRRAGHEIGDHSFDHRVATSQKSAALRADAERNAAFLRPFAGEAEVSSYAYPFGEVSPRTKAIIAGRFASARGIQKGVNAGWVDLAELKAIPLEYRRWRPDEIDMAIARARAIAGWVIFFTHDVAEQPSPFGCTPAMLIHTLERLAVAGVEILPVNEALARTVFGRP
ncbi:MAG: polysaccharide deacetylase family protein [Caulobacteraceae bacterium]